MADKFEFSIIAKFKDLASRKVKQLQRVLKTGWGAGAGRGFAGMFGGGVGRRLAQKMATRPGGAGGIISDLVTGAGGLLALPVRVVGAFARLVPGIGGVISGVVGSAASVFEGLVGIVGNIAGAMVNAFGAILKGFVGIAEKVVGAVGSALGKLAKVAGAIGLGTGAVLAWQMIKGIKENMNLADLRVALKKLLGAAWKEAEDYARKLSLKTPFTPIEMIETTKGIAAVGRDYRKWLGLIADWAAAANKPLEQVLETFQRAATGMTGRAMMGARRLLISRKDLEALGAEFNKQGSYIGENFVVALMAAVQRKFGGMSKEAAKVGKGPISTFKGVIQALRQEFTRPWSDRLNQALIDLNERLLAFAETDKWRRIVTWSGRVAEALDTRLRRALAWLTSREWRFGNLKAGLAQLKSAIVELAQTAAGPAKDVITDVLGFLEAKARTLFFGLWDLVGKNLKDSITGALSDVAGAMQSAYEKRMQGYRQHWAQTVFAKDYGDLSAGERRIVEGNVKRQVTKEKAVLGVMKSAASGARDIADALSQSTAKWNDTSEERAQADRDAAQAARELQGSLDSLRGAVQESKPGLQGSAGHSGPCGA